MGFVIDGTYLQQGCLSNKLCCIRNKNTKVAFAQQPRVNKCRVVVFINKTQKLGNIHAITKLT